MVCALGRERRGGGRGQDLVSAMLDCGRLVMLTVRSMACAIRECYAVALTVLILVDDASNRNGEI